MDGPEKLEQSELLKTKGTNFFKVNFFQDCTLLTSVVFMIQYDLPFTVTGLDGQLPCKATL